MNKFQDVKWSPTMPKFKRRAHSAFTRLKRTALNVDNIILADYFRKNDVAKLHIGCGDNIIDGWLNSDFRPKSHKKLHLDATGAFPLPNESFDYIFSEHMIEHIPYEKANNMLTECCRALMEKYEYQRQI